MFKIGLVLVLLIIVGLVYLEWRPRPVHVWPLAPPPDHPQEHEFIEPRSP